MVNRSVDPQLVRAFYRAAMFLKARIEHDGWTWSSNYLREHVRCATGLKFTNSVSPKILRALLHEHPELQPYIGLKPLKQRLQHVSDKGNELDLRKSSKH